MDGVRAELAVHGPSNCPVAMVSTETDRPVTDVSWSRAVDGSVTEEFRVDAGATVEGSDALENAEPLLDVGDERAYRFERDADVDCACGVVESLGQPLADVRVERGVLVLTLDAPSVDDLREVVAALEDAAERVELRYLVHAADGGSTDRTVVDRGRLTDRQREVLRTAHQMGYFEYPGGSNATEVAEALDIGLSTLSEHLAAAQGKLLEEMLEPA
jgi:hypothetical protein